MIETIVSWCASATIQYLLEYLKDSSKVWVLKTSNYPLTRAFWVELVWSCDIPRPHDWNDRLLLRKRAKSNCILFPQSLIIISSVKDCWPPGEPNDINHNLTTSPAAASEATAQYFVPGLRMIQCTLFIAVSKRTSVYRSSKVRRVCFQKVGLM